MGSLWGSTSGSPIQRGFVKPIFALIPAPPGVLWGYAEAHHHPQMIRNPLHGGMPLASALQVKKEALGQVRLQTGWLPTEDVIDAAFWLMRRPGRARSVTAQRMSVSVASLQHARDQLEIWWSPILDLVMRQESLVRMRAGIISGGKRVKIADQEMRTAAVTIQPKSRRPPLAKTNRLGTMIEMGLARFAVPTARTAFARFTRRARSP